LTDATLIALLAGFFEPMPTAAGDWEKRFSPDSGDASGPAVPVADDPPLLTESVRRSDSWPGDLTADPIHAKYRFYDTSTRYFASTIRAWVFNVH